MDSESTSSSKCRAALPDGIIFEHDLPTAPIAPSRAVLLRYPLYKLYYMTGTENFRGLSDTETAAFLQEDEAPLRSAVIDALRWAHRHPEADLTAILPDLPFSNEDIHVFVGTLLAHLEK